jgi:WD40 repeat protein
MGLGGRKTQGRSRYIESTPLTLVLFSDDSPSASIYSLAVNETGSVIAAGTPQKFIRVFDPRSKNAQVQRLLGHTDTVRDLLVSQDGRWVAILKILTLGSFSFIRLHC